MGRFKSYLSGMEDPQRMALARALQFGGSALSQGAGNQGFGALAEAVPAATYGYGQGMEEARKEEERKRQEEEQRLERERKRITEDRQDVRWEHYLEGIESAKTEAERKGREKEAQAAAEAERRKGMLEEIRGAAGDNAARRASLLSPTKLESEYMELTGAPEPKPPSIREIGGDWYIFDPEHPNADEVGYRLYKKEPEKAGGGGGERSLTPGQLRNEANKIADREVGTWPQFLDQAISNARAKNPEIEYKPESRLTIDHAGIRKEFTKRRDAAFEEAMRQLGGGGNSPRVPAADFSNVRTGASGPAVAPAEPAGQAQGRFEQLAAQVEQQLEDRGAPPAAKARVQAVVEAVRTSVPPEVRDSEEFLSMLQKEIASGKDPQKIAQEIREAFGGR